MSNELYDAWDESFKKPFGALPAFAPAAFFIRPPRALGVRAARFSIRADAGGGWSADMQPAAGDGARDAFFCTCAVPTPGLYWYTFTLETQSGPRRLTREKGGKARLAEPNETGGEWQLTVYDPAFTTPDWLAGGTMYQIFPDRFRRAGSPPAGLPPERVLREDWDGTPPYRAAEDPAAFSNTYFGGNLAGIREKLSYLRELGVNVLYLNPIFEAHSNHRYNTADYLKIDPLLGTEADFAALCAEAKAMGISIILDGVFGHTGDDSVYFNRTGRYGDGGAYRSTQSPYFTWYRFKQWPDQYRCWWNFLTLPQVNQDAPSFADFITGENGVLAHWMKAGARGWRLDVADELSEAFIRRLRARIKGQDAQGAVIGEVWEDASNKTAYGKRRSYFLGQELDGVMNYPFRSAILAFLREGNADALHLTVTGIAENYPPPALRAVMNVLGTHDTVRALTALAGENAQGRGRDWKAAARLSPAARARGIALLKLGFALLFFLPGVPCIYYGDEAGMEGYEDPFCRGTFPWGREDKDLLRLVRALGRLRAACPLMEDGAYRTVHAAADVFAFSRGADGRQLLCAVNRSDTDAVLPPPQDGYAFKLLLGARGDDFWHLPPQGCKIYGAGRWTEHVTPMEGSGEDVC